MDKILKEQNTNRNKLLFCFDLLAKAQFTIGERNITAKVAENNSLAAATP